MLQLTELVTPWSFCLAIHEISSHRCCGRPIALTVLNQWTMRCGACFSNASTVAGFATSTTWNSVSSRSVFASTRTSLTEQFVFDYARISVQTAATLSTNCNWCFCVRTAKATFQYWKVMFLSSIFKTAVAQKLCGGFCWNLQRLCRKDDN